jgi:hypothetical protein
MPALVLCSRAFAPPSFASSIVHRVGFTADTLIDRDDALTRGAPPSADPARIILEPGFVAAVRVAAGNPPILGVPLVGRPVDVRRVTPERTNARPVNETRFDSSVSRGTACARDV